jgi:hypothetical protein
LPEAPPVAATVNELLNAALLGAGVVTSIVWLPLPIVQAPLAVTVTARPESLVGSTVKLEP